MISAKEEILSKIRRAVSGSTRSPYENLPRNYPQSGTLDNEARIRLFEDRLRDYDAVVYRCAEADLPHTILEAIAARGRTSLLIPKQFPLDCLPDSLQFRTDNESTYEELDSCQGALTGCALAIAETGTIVLRHSEAEGRRALTLIPDYHLCLVYADQILETVVEGIRKMGTFAHAPITTVSGPSATADIEMIRIKGVHGPRLLDVIVIE